jgi:hypothetical protein
VHPWFQRLTEVLNPAAMAVEISGRSRIGHLLRKRNSIRVMAL